jgi:subtilisin family serine protease
MAQGQNSAVFWNGSIRSLNGTSFSSPIMAGMIACLVQAAPYVDPYQIKQSVIETGDNYNTPNSDYGYGIPDFSKNKFLDVDNIHQNIRIAYPNPTTKFISINDLIRLTDYTIIDMYGKIVLQGNTAGKISLAQLRSGIYLLQIEDKLFKIIKYE